jgi:hypothetical protein
MTNLPKEDRIAMGIFSGLFIAGGAVLRAMAMSFYWMALVIGFLLGGTVLLSKGWRKYRRRRRK